MVSSIFPVFGNKIRAKLILCLMDKPKDVSELVQTCHLAQSAVSQHLTKLKSAHLVRTTRNGQHIMYELQYKKAATISRLLFELSKEVL